MLPHGRPKYKVIALVRSTIQSFGDSFEQMGETEQDQQLTSCTDRRFWGHCSHGWQSFFVSSEGIAG